MASQPSAGAQHCPQCGVVMTAGARFCSSCGHITSVRSRAPRLEHVPSPGPEFVDAQSAPAPDIIPAGRGARCSAALLDLAAMMSPALPLSIAAAVLGVAEVVYVVQPVAFVAVFLWMQIWQGLSGTSFGKSMIGVRLVRESDHRAPGFAATMTRSGMFLITLGGAGLPVLTGRTAVSGLHDRASGLVVLDVARGANPLGARQTTTLRRSADRGLNRVQSPVPVQFPSRG